MTKRNALILIVVLAAGTVGYIAWHSHRTNNSANNTQNTTEFSFKELNLKVALPQNLKGLSYDASDQSAKPTPPLLMRLKIASFTTLANQCLGASSSSYQNFATLIKQPGDYDSNPYHVGEKIKQFDTYYIADVGSSLPKNYKCKDSSKASSLAKLNQELKQSLIQAFKESKK